MQLREFSRTLECIIGLFAFLFLAVSSRADTNSWVKSTSGDWQEITSWSLGILPDSSQSVAITNAGEKTVTINNTTAQNFPQSLTVNDVVVGGSNTTFMLDYIGTNQPFMVMNGLTVAGADSTNQNTLMCLESGLLIENGGLYITNGQVIQGGGFIRVTNGNIWLNGAYYLTNGLLEAENLFFSKTPVGYPYTYQSGSFFQYGGVVNVSNIYDGSAGPSNFYRIYAGDLNVLDTIHVGEIGSSYFEQYGGRVTAASVALWDDSLGSRYTLFDGELILSSGLSIGGVYGGSKFIQNGGTNWAPSLTARADDRYGPGTYILNGGTLYTINVLLSASGEGRFEQNGGFCIVTNTLTILGIWDYAHGSVAYFTLTRGTLIASNLTLAGGTLEITNGSALFADVHVSGYPSYDQSYGSIFLYGGTFSCDNFHRTGEGGAAIQQNAGILTVSNLFAFGGVGGGYYISPLNYQMAGALYMPAISK